MDFPTAHSLLAKKGELAIKFPTIEGGYVDVWASKLRAGSRTGTEVIRVQWAMSASTIDAHQWYTPKGELMVALVAAIKESLSKASVSQTREESTSQDSEHDDTQFENDSSQLLMEQLLLSLRRMSALGINLQPSEQKLLESHPLDANEGPKKVLSCVLEALRTAHESGTSAISWKRHEVDFLKETFEILLSQVSSDR